MFRKKSFNQTEFSQVAPLIESPTAPSQNRLELKEVEKKGGLNLKLLGAVLGSILTLVFLFLLALSLFPKQSRPPTSSKPTPTPTPFEQDEGLVGKLKELKTELELNDPTEDDLYFPNVERRLYLDPPRNN